MAEWLIERGIGETRAALIEDGAIVEARIELDGVTPAGAILAARLIDVGQSSRNAIARDANGTEYLLPKAPSGVTQGETFNIEILREAIPGREPWKRPLALATDQPPAPSPTLAGRELPFPSPGANALDEAGWDDAIEQARTGMVAFAAGTLRISLTPAMTLIDVDGAISPAELAVAGATEAARAIRRLGIGGSIGIDLPTIAGKVPRQAAAAAIDDHLPQPFERTAVNGFGFVQIIRPRSRASLLEIWSDRASAEARALLRRAASGSGSRRLVAHPAVIAVLERNPAWLEALARQVGGTISLRADPSVPISAGDAEPA
ncbi:ribonuclease [Sphingomonas sp.]|uniref:ribonuclease n=1 Tax=Sphingomonas sp. TaxID=28214 RepID=UPI00286A22D0|nr:ribonuclease [Sphingomonas sp.]